MTTDTILIFQGILITLQIINAGLVNVLPETRTAAFVQLCLAAIVGGAQFILQHYGNQTMPPGGKTNGVNGVILSGQLPPAK